MQVFYPDVAEIANGFAHARCHLEGMVGDASEQYPHCTSVKNSWTLEEERNGT